MNDLFGAESFAESQIRELVQGLVQRLLAEREGQPPGLAHVRRHREPGELHRHERQPRCRGRGQHRLRALGIYAMPGRRAALTDLAAKLPAAVLADLLSISRGTAVSWVHQADGDWSRYAAELARQNDHQT